MSDKSGYRKVGQDGPFPDLINLTEKAGIELNGVLIDKRQAPWDEKVTIYTFELLEAGTYSYWDRESESLKSKEYKVGEKVQVRGTGSIDYALKSTPMGSKVILEYHGKIKHPTDPKKTLHDVDVWVDERGVGNEPKESAPSQPSESSDEDDEDDKDLPF